MAKAITDLGKLTENQQCRTIAVHAGRGESVGFIVVNEEKIIARFTRKIKEIAPNVIVERIGQLTEHTFALKAYLNRNN